MNKITVRVKPAYDVIIGKGIIKNAGMLISKATGSRRFIVVTNRKVFALHGRELIKSLTGLKHTVHFIKDGEEYKNLSTLDGIYKACVKAGLDRSSCIIAFGGGVTGDTAGFAAATYMRGIKYAQVPTTLLSQVDSSVGGKTGIDAAYGKNMIGAFYQPSIVLADTDTLKTLNKSEFNNGMAEVIKHGIIADKKYFDYIIGNEKRIKSMDDYSLEYIVAGSVRIKSRIVAADEKEITGLRALLNFGHTAGHAIETAMHYKGIKHGEAVAVGSVIAAKISAKAGFCDESTVRVINEAYNLFNLIKPLKKVKKALILSLLFNDKKVKDGKIRFVLTKGIGSAKLIDNVDLSLIKREILNFL